MSGHENERPDPAGPADAGAPGRGRPPLRVLLGLILLGLILRTAILLGTDPHAPDREIARLWILETLSPGEAPDCDPGGTHRPGIPAAAGRTVTPAPIPAVLHGLLGRAWSCIDPTFAHSDGALFRTFLSIPSILADVLLALVAFALVRRREPGWAPGAAALVLFHPALAFLSAGSGWPGSIGLLLGLTGYLLADLGRPGAGVGVAAAAAGVDLHFLVMIPPLILRPGCDPAGAGTGTPGRLALLGRVAAVLAGIAALEQAVLPDAPVGAWTSWARHPVTTAGTFNLWFLFTTDRAPDLGSGFAIPPLAIGLGAFLLALAALLGSGAQPDWIRGPRGAAFLPFVASLAMTRAVPGTLAIPLVFLSLSRDTRLPAVTLGVFLLGNLAWLHELSTGWGGAVSAGFGLLLAAGHLLVFGHVFKGWWFSDPGGSVPTDRAGDRRPGPAILSPRGWLAAHPALSWKREILVVTILTVSFAALRLHRLGEPAEKVFDEVYHAKAGREILDGKAPNEWVHPPLAKLFIAAGITLLGDEAFGWRFTPWLAGCLVLPVLYLLGRGTVGDPRFALLGTLLLALDGCYFVMSRTAMTNVFATLFQIGAVTCFWFYLAQASRPGGRLGGGWWLLGTSLAIGLGISTRWTCLWLLAFLGIAFALHGLARLGIDLAHGKPKGPILIAGLRGVASGLVHFLVLPLGLYVLSYMVLVHMGSYESLEETARLQPQIYMFHSTFTTHHPYYSQWYSWSFTHRPVWYSYVTLDDKRISGIVALGNPVLWWVSIPAVLLGLVVGLRHRDRGMLFLAGAYLCLYAPWGLSPRVFNYSHYYLEPLPYALMLIAALARREWNRRLHLPELLIVLAVVAWTFAFFYPLLSGLPITPEAYGRRVWSDHWI